MHQIQSDLKYLLVSLCDFQQPATFATYQNAYLRFRGLVEDAAGYNEVYRECPSCYLLNVSDET